MLLDTNIDLVAAQLAADGLAIAFVTQFELRRGIEELGRRGEGRRALVHFEKFMERVQVLELDAAVGEGWNLAARLWAEERSKGCVFTDADLLIATTAAFNGHEFATSEIGLAEGLARLTFPVAVRFVPMG